jgi:hypothetical protein
LSPSSCQHSRNERGDFLDNFELIQYYLRILEYSASQLDDALVTYSSNLEASFMWEEQLCLVVKDGSLCFLFDNKSNLYNSCRFEMLAALSQHYHPDIVVNAYTSLLSLFNDV